MAYTKYSLTPANNTAAPPDGAPEGMLPSAVNDTMRDMMAQIRDVGDGIRGGTYTMTAPVITGGSINGTTIGATTASTGKFSTLTNAALTSGRVTYAGTSGVLQDDADFTFNGTTVTMANDASISGLTVGKGGGAVSTNTAFGSNSPLGSNTTGASSVAIGSYALNQNLTGIDNTAIGFGAGFYITGSANTAIGRSALSTVSASTGSNNTAVGFYALQSNTTASSNTAVGYQAAYSNTTGQGITAIGKSVLFANTTGYSNVGVGGTRDGALSGALISNTTGNENVAMGVAALSGNTTGSSNVGLGHSALQGNTTASNNTAVGYQALYTNSTGANLTAIGYGSGYNITGNNNTVIGYGSGDGITTGTGNLCVGYLAGSSGTKLTTGSNNVFIGGRGINAGAGARDQSIVIATEAQAPKGDSTFFVYAGGGTSFNGGNTTTWTTTSDRRIKKNIVDNNEGLEKITAIKVRNFEYRLPEEITEVDKDQAITKSGVQLGVIAQELQEVCPDCVTEQSTGVLSVNTDDVFWHMVNAIKELKQEVDSLKAQLNK